MMALFILKLVTGVTLMWWLMPRRDVTDGFFRIQMRIVLGLLVLIPLCLTADGTWPQAVEVSEQQSQFNQDLVIVTRGLCVAGAFVSYAGSVFWALGRRTPGNICVHLLTLICCTMLALHSFNVPNSAGAVQQLLSDFASAGVLGGVLTGMLLGHWYLTTPTMSIEPLWWFNRAILFAAVLRMAVSCWALVGSGLVETTTEQIWLTLRWVGGVLTPILSCLLVWRILKHRNTQSATGVLFAGLILVFMGEMTASLLERDTMIPY